jgi:hypothetical protein
MLACQRVGKNSIFQIAFNFGVLGAIAAANDALRIMYIKANASAPFSHISMQIVNISTLCKQPNTLKLLPQTLSNPYPALLKGC